MSTKIKSIFGIFILLIGISITVLMLKYPQVFNSNASPNEIPLNLEISNVSDSQFSVSYLTNSKTIGNIFMGTDPDKLDILVLDDRDQLNQQVGNYFSHQITPKDLEPNTTYYFLINSGSKKYLNNNAVFEIKTAPLPSNSPSEQSPLSGEIILSSGESPEEGLIFLKIPGSQTISSQITNGKYIIPLNSLLTEKLNEYFIPSSSEVINLKVFSGDESTNELINISETNPVKEITLSKNNSENSKYNLTEINLSPTPNTSEKPSNTVVDNNSGSLESSKNQKTQEKPTVQVKDARSDQKFSVIIFGLGAFLIVGGGLILLQATRKKTR